MSKFDQVLRTFLLPFGRTLIARRAPEANMSKPRCVEKSWWIPALAPVSLLAFYPPHKCREVSHYIIFCDNSTLSVPLRHVSDPSSLLRRASAEEENRTGFFWKKRNGTLLVIFSASKLIGGALHVLDPSQR